MTKDMTDTRKAIEKIVGEENEELGRMSYDYTISVGTGGWWCKGCTLGCRPTGLSSILSQPTKI